MEEFKGKVTSEETLRPFAIMIKINNITKKQTNKIIKDLVQFDTKAYINGDYVKVTFPIHTAVKVTVEELGNIFYDATLRKVHGSQENSMLYFKFSDKVDKIHADLVEDI